jgi:hypothetical protein
LLCRGGGDISWSQGSYIMEAWQNLGKILIFKYSFKVSSSILISISLYIDIDY